MKTWAEKKERKKENKNSCNLFDNNNGRGRGTFLRGSISVLDGYMKRSFRSLTTSVVFARDLIARTRIIIVGRGEIVGHVKRPGENSIVYRVTFYFSGRGLKLNSKRTLSRFLLPSVPAWNARNIINRVGNYREKLSNCGKFYPSVISKSPLYLYFFRENVLLD